ncbi:MAG: FMN-binding protein [Actinobacteria bacterium]|nr:FMN-binding protein [Actinomycetota bacterium]
MSNVKRTVATIGSAVTGFGAVLGAHIAGPSPHRLVLSAPEASPGSTSPPASSATTTSPSRSGAGAIGPPAPSSVTTTVPASTGPAASAVGASEQYGYGVLSVKVTAEGGHITDVRVANLQTAESYSQMIAREVIPMLRQEVLKAQGVQVNFISGATYTTEAYLLSVQSALKKLNI